MCALYLDSDSNETQKRIIFNTICVRLITLVNSTNGFRELKEFQNRNTIWSRDPISGYISKRIEIRISKRNLHSHVHCSIIHNNQDVGTNLVSISGWMDKEYIYIWILFSHNKKEILQFATTWMKLEGIMLNEISQTEKDKYCMISLVSGI